MDLKSVYCLMIILVGLCSCDAREAGSTPADTIRKYERLVLEMKPDSISQLFTEDAQIGHEGQFTVKGKDSIFAFLASFKKFHVISNRDSIIASSKKDDSSVVKGWYKQTVITPGNDTVHVKGEFTATMIHEKNKDWLISTMMTRSLK